MTPCRIHSVQAHGWLGGDKMGVIRVLHIPELPQSYCSSLGLFAGVLQPAEWYLPLMRISGGSYQYTHYLLALETCAAPQVPPAWPQFSSPIKTFSLILFLQSHPDQAFAHYIYSRLTEGFHIGYNHWAVCLKSRLRTIHPAWLLRQSLKATLDWR